MARASKAVKEIEKILPIHPRLLEGHRGTLDPVVASWREKKRIPPVLLLIGPSGIGKREISFHLANLFLCERAGLGGAASADAAADDGFGSLFGDAPPVAQIEEGIEPCWECASCLRAKSGNLLDILEIAPEAESTTLKIDQFRAMKESQGFSGYSGRRVFLIPGSERMTLQAANSLLKILEEPPQGWVFILTTPDPSQLPSTVVSRCQALRLKPLPKPLIRDMLVEEGTPKERVDLATSLSEGSLGRARELSAEEAWEKRSSLLEFLIMPQGNLNTLVDWAAGSEKDFTTLLDQMEQLLFDLVRSLETEPVQWQNTDAVKVLSQHREMRLKKGKADARAFWMGRLETLFALRRFVNSPLNTKLMVQDLLVPFLPA